jgi:hypothetical protein
MNAAMIAQLIVTLGPVALDLIPKLMNVWHKPELTKEEVLDLCKVSERSYESFVGRADK